MALDRYLIGFLYSRKLNMLSRKVIRKICLLFVCGDGENGEEETDAENCCCENHRLLWGIEL